MSQTYALTKVCISDEELQNTDMLDAEFFLKIQAKI